MTTRTCEGCHACCVVYLFDDKPIGLKPQFLACPKLTECGRCGIYESRPETCSGFQCAWLAGELPEGYAPKEVGFVVNVQTTATVSGKLTAMTVQESRWNALQDNARFERLLSGLIQSFPYPVVVSGFRETPGPAPLQWVVGFSVDPQQYTIWREWLLTEMGHPGPIPENPPTPPTDPDDRDTFVFPEEGVENPSFYAIS